MPFYCVFIYREYRLVSFSRLSISAPNDVTDPHKDVRYLAAILQSDTQYHSLSLFELAMVCQ